MKQYNYVYLITNQINGKVYIGKHSTNNLDDNYMGSGVLINKAKLKYGIENFTKTYLAFCDNEEKLNWLERFYIKKYKSKERGYNLTDGGDGSLGCHWNLTTETKQKMSISKKGKSNHREGTIHTEETKQKMSISKIGNQNGAGNKGKPKQKFMWLTELNEIRIMDKSKVKRWHPDWVLYEQK